MNTSLRMLVEEETQIGEARRSLAELCNGLGGDEHFCGKAAIIVNELGSNLIKHASGGELIFRRLADPQQPGIEILALDRGPGMANLGECLRDGYSSAGTAGQGLGAVRRVADAFEISSVPGKGTVVWCTLSPRSSGTTSAGRFQLGAVSVPLSGETECGDAWSTRLLPSGIRIFVADGLGHGPLAAAAAQLAIRAFQCEEGSCAEVLERVHESLRSTRGAAGALVEVDVAGGQVSVAGVGNVVVRILDGEGFSHQVASMNGTLGAAIPKLREFTHAWDRDSILIVHSDGVASQWNLKGYAGLSHRHPALIAGVLYRDHARARDDASVVVVKHAP